MAQLSRRNFLKFLVATGILSHELDLEKLFWIPGEKKIFLPSPGISISQIVAIEMERILLHIKYLFEQDHMFYQTLDDGTKLLSNRTFLVPLNCKLGVRK